MRDALGISLVDLEAARALRQHPTRPDAFDLLLRGRSLYLQPYSKQRREQALALFEQALALDPNSVKALAAVAESHLSDKMQNGYWPTIETRDRVAALIIRARAIDPNSESVHALSALWQLTEGRCPDTLTTVKPLTEMFPNNRVFYFILAQCEAMTGNAAEAIDLLGKARRLNPRDPLMYLNYELVGRYSMLLGRDQDALEWTERSLAVDPDGRSVHRAFAYSVLAAVFARDGRNAEAHRAAAAAERLWPFGTVRGHSPPPWSGPVFAAQSRQFQDALLLAGERDHADEDADFGVPADAVLHATRLGYTPTSAPGAMVVRTADLVKLIDQDRPLVLHALNFLVGRSVPGAVGLRYAGLGGDFADGGQERLRRKMRELTGGNLAKPIVAFGWSSERFDGRNLALRLVALGYTNVFWYRGGLEAWEANGLPETELEPTDW
jgi:adenylate cyclase